MRLGSTVTGRMHDRGRAPCIAVPASALATADGQPAVWVVDPASADRGAAPIEVVRYEPGSVVVAAGARSRATSW